MNAIHVVVPLSTARLALMVLQAYALEQGLHYEVIKDKPGTERWHKGDEWERAKHHEQAMRLALAGAKGATLHEVCLPLIREAQDLTDSAQKTLSVEDHDDSLVGVQRCLTALARALSVPEGGAPA